MTGLVASAVSTAAMGLTSALTMFALIRFAGGIASALVLVYGSTVVLERLGAAGRSDLAARHFAGVGVVQHLSEADLLFGAACVLGDQLPEKEETGSQDDPDQNLFDGRVQSVFPHFRYCDSLKCGGELLIWRAVYKIRRHPGGNGSKVAAQTRPRRILPAQTTVFDSTLYDEDSAVSWAIFVQLKGKWAGEA